MRIKALLLAITLATPSAWAELPSLGGGNSSQAQLEQEYQIGQAWVKLLRSNSQLLDSPVIESYLSALLWRLVPNSELQDRRLELVTIDRSEINAFAVPGGIIGVHAGLLAASRHEDELASVLAHELAHLSQRHFAQQQNVNERQAPLVLAGLLGAILLSGVNTNAGMAALHGTIGADRAAKLAYSRENELDADQTGMKTLTQSGFDPAAMPRMFALLQEANRFSGQELPEFLRTHPVTQARIADSTNRAQSLPRVQIQVADSVEYRIARAQAASLYLDSSPTQTGSSAATDQAPYLQFLSALKRRQLTTAAQLWQKLPSEIALHPWAQISRAELLVEQGNLTAANALLEELRDLYPDDYAVQRARAKFLADRGDYQQAIQLYRDLSRDHSQSTQIWYQLAELYGQNGDIAMLHRARIEFFSLRGEFDLALRQIEFARRDAAQDRFELGWIDNREAELKAARERMDQLLN